MTVPPFYGTIRALLGRVRAFRRLCRDLNAEFKRGQHNSRWE